MKIELFHTNSEGKFERSTKVYHAVSRIQIFYLDELSNAVVREESSECEIDIFEFLDQVKTKGWMFCDGEWRIWVPAARITGIKIQLKVEESR